MATDDEVARRRRGGAGLGTRSARAARWRRRRRRLDARAKHRAATDQLIELIQRRLAAGQGLCLHIAHRVASVHAMTLTVGPSEFGGLQVDLIGPLALDGA